MNEEPFAQRKKIKRRRELNPRPTRILWASQVHRDTSGIPLETISPLFIQLQIDYCPHIFPNQRNNNLPANALPDFKNAAICGQVY